MPGSCHGFARWRAQSALGASGSPSTTRRPRALPADADRGRVARAAGLWPDPPQPRGELGDGRRAGGPRGRSRRAGAAVRRSSRPAGAARRDRRRRRRARPGRRARHARRGHGAVPRPHDAARGGLARRRRPAQLRHQRRDAAGDRRRRVVPRPRVRGRLGGGPRPDRRAPAARDATRQPHDAAQPDRHHARPRDAGRGDRARRAAWHGAAPRRRDVPRDDVRRAAPRGGDAVGPGDQRDQPVEDVRPAGHPRRVARDARRRCSRRSCSPRRSRS